MNTVEVTGCRNIIVSDSHIINVLSNINSFSYIVIGYWIWTSELNYTKRPQSSFLLCIVLLMQGHLARYLAYHYGLTVVTVDTVSCHLEAAAKFDWSVEKTYISFLGLSL